MSRKLLENHQEFILITEVSDEAIVSFPYLPQDADPEKIRGAWVFRHPRRQSDFLAKI